MFTTFLWRFFNNEYVARAHLFFASMPRIDYFFFLACLGVLIGAFSIFLYVFLLKKLEEASGRLYKRNPKKYARLFRS